MKKSKILFILTAIFVVITIVAHFYMNYREQICVDFYDKHPEYESSDVYIRHGRMSEEEYEKLRKQYLRLDKENSKATTIFNISCGITAVLLVSGIVVFIVEKKKKI